MPHLGDKLREFRTEKKKSQAEMANFIGIGRRSYQEIEKSGIIKKSEVLLKIQNKTNISAQKNASGETNGIEKHFSVKDAGGMILENQIEILASTRVLLSILAEIQAPQMKEKALPTQLLSIYRTMVKDEAKQVRNELRQKSL